ncbi:MAG: hypothetical protein ACJ8CR_26245, partial [Roseiflexaceae bacterium]
VLIGLHDGKTTVRTGQLAGNGDEINWAPVPTVLGNESSDFQLVDVVPEQTDKTSPLSVIVRLQGKQRATVVIKALGSQEKAYGGASERVSIPPTTTPPTTTTSGEAIEAVVFSLDGLPRKADEEGQPKVSLSTLDGYILTGKDGNWMISDFSKGGPPNSAPNVVSDFIAAGAASGDAVLFFNEKDPVLFFSEKDPEGVNFQKKYADIHVVVTTLRGVELPKDYKAVSPVFSIASTEALPPDTDPTLLIVTPLDTADTTSLCICRLTDGKLDELPTFFSKGPTFAATPLKSGGGTLLEGGSGPHVERYVLATVPSRRLKQPQ